MLFVQIIDTKNKVINCGLKIGLVEIPGIYNISKHSDLKKAYKKWNGEDKDGEIDPFEDETEFVDVFLEICKKIKSSEFTVIRNEGIVELTDDIEDFLTKECIWNEIDRLVREYSAYLTGKPMVRDWRTMLEIFLTILSCKTKSPLNLSLSGPAASGKSFVTIRVANVFPTDMKRIINSASKTAIKYDFDYRDENGKYIVDLEGICYICLEKSEVKFIESMKAIMSHDAPEVENIVSAKNVVGDIESRTYVYKNWPSFIVASVQHEDSREQTTRALQAQPDITEDKKKEASAAYYKHKGSPRAYFINCPDIKPLTDGLSWLKIQQCINPFCDILSDMLTMDGRMQDKLFSLIDSFTVLHQLNRCKLRGKRDGQDADVLLNSFEDVVIALGLFETILSETELGVTGLDLQVYQIMNHMQGVGVSLTHNAILERLEVDNIQVKTEVDLKMHIETLRNHTLVGVRESGRGNAPRTYEVLHPTQKYESRRLVPLFIEKCRQGLPEIEKSLKDSVYRGVKLVGQRANVSKLPLLDHLLTQEYLHRYNSGTPIWYIFDSEYRESIFAYQHPLLQAGTEYIEKKRKKEAIKKVSDELIRSGKVMDDEEKFYDLAARIAEQREYESLLAAEIGEGQARIIVEPEIEKLEKQMAGLKVKR